MPIDEKEEKRYPAAAGEKPFKKDTKKKVAAGKKPSAKSDQKGTKKAG